MSGPRPGAAPWAHHDRPADVGLCHKCWTSGVRVLVDDETGEPRCTKCTLEAGT